jgi:hypothetical protein
MVAIQIKAGAYRLRRQVGLVPEHEMADAKIAPSLRRDVKVVRQKSETT